MVIGSVLAGHHFECRCRGGRSEEATISQPAGKVDSVETVDVNESKGDAADEHAEDSFRDSDDDDDADDGGEAAARLKMLAWHAAWHVASDAAKKREAADNAIRSFRHEVATLADTLPVELLESIQWLCWSASQRAAKERLHGDTKGAKKAQQAFEKRRADIAQRVPGELASGLTQLAERAAWHAANTCAMKMSAELRACVAEDARMDLYYFEEAASALARAERYLPRLWRGTPVNTLPVADGLKWMAWNAVARGQRARGLRAGQQARAAVLGAPRGGRGGRGRGWRRLPVALLERRVARCERRKGTTTTRGRRRPRRSGTPPPSRGGCRRCWRRHQRSPARGVARGQPADGQQDGRGERLKGFEAAAKVVAAWADCLPAALPTVGAPPRPRRVPKKKRRKLSALGRWRRSRRRPWQREARRAAAVDPRRALLSEGHCASLATDAQSEWTARPYPVLIDPARLAALPGGAAAGDEGAGAASPLEGAGTADAEGAAEATEAAVGPTQRRGLPSRELMAAVPPLLLGGTSGELQATFDSGEIVIHDGKSAAAAAAAAANAPAPMARAAAADGGDGVTRGGRARACTRWATAWRPSLARRRTSCGGARRSRSSTATATWTSCTTTATSRHSRASACRCAPARQG